MTPDAQEYVAHLIDLWQDVPVSFMRTEFDRYFCKLQGKKSLPKNSLKKMAVTMVLKIFSPLKRLC